MVAVCYFLQLYYIPKPLFKLGKSHSFLASVRFSIGSAYPVGRKYTLKIFYFKKKDKKGARTTVELRSRKGQKEKCWRSKSMSQLARISELSVFINQVK